MPLRSHQHRVYGRSLQTARTGSFYSASVLVLAFRLLPYGLSVTSGAVRQALADDSFERALGALHIVHAEPHAVAIPEIEFRQVAVQVLLGAMLIHALHATLEDRIEAFDRIGGDDVML